MQSPLLKLLLVSFLTAAAYGCGGGGSEPDAQIVAEGVAVEEILPEDVGFAGRDLVPPSFVVVTPRVGAGTGDAWAMWPDSLAREVLDANNLYAHSDQALSWPTDGVGIYSSRADCSGYVTRSLMKAFEFTAEDITAWMGSKGPSSARYHDNIVFQNNFHRIQRASDVRRGDILASKYLDRDQDQDPNKVTGTGHTMIAADRAVKRAVSTEPVIAGTVQYELLIIDSTSSPHSTGDTRKGTGSNGADQDGAGRGTMRLYADAVSDQIVGYTWSRSTGSVYYTATSPLGDRRSLVVGRMTFTQ